MHSEDQTNTPDKNAPPAWPITVISASILILELTFIRQIPAEVRSVSYFSNLLLMSSFFGLGIGFILQRARTLELLLPLGLILAWGYIMFARGIIVYEQASPVHFWLEPPALGTAPLRIPIFLSIILAFLFTALPFMALGQALARNMERQARLIAYSWDIAGSLLGTIVFAISSYLQAPPWIWPPILMLAWTVIFQRGILPRALALAAGFVFLTFYRTPHSFRWSPYYLVQHMEREEGLFIWVNSSFHQAALDFTPTDNPKIAEMQAVMRDKFGAPYRQFREHHGGKPPERVLVLGAGTGNDLVMALENGAQSVTAVEIDPVIQDIGRRLNRNKPYDNPKVIVHIDDARHFLRTTEEKYDMIVFGTLDSQTLLSGIANLRLENYVYTTEALRDARSLLRPGGMVALYYSVFRPWILSRIYSTAREAFGDNTRMYFWEQPFLFNTLIMGAPDIPEFRGWDETIKRYGADRPSIDDWPFLYLQKPTVAPVYRHLMLSVLALTVCAFVVLRSVEKQTGLHLNFLFLGIGFTLMEAAAIVRLALVFGSTWVVNAVVFSAVLLTIFLANLLVMKGRAPSLQLGWVGLFGWVLANYLFPVEVLSEISRLFGRQEVGAYPLGINLLGAMAGGVIEYLSMLIGMRNVWLMVLVIYLAAWLATSRSESGGRAAAI